MKNKYQMRKILLFLSFLTLVCCGGIEDRWMLAGCYDDGCGCLVIIEDDIIKNGCGRNMPSFFECEYEKLDGDRIRAFNCSGRSRDGKAGKWVVKYRDGVGDVLFSPGNVGFKRK